MNLEFLTTLTHVDREKVLVFDYKKNLYLDIVVNHAIETCQ